MKNYQIMTDEELIRSLKLIYPSKRINRQILDELYKRDIKNNLHILRYLLELKTLKINTWFVNRLLLSLYDPFHKSNDFMTHEDSPELRKYKRDYKIKEIIFSIKSKKTNQDFLKFISHLEYFTINLNTGTDIFKKSVINEYSKFIIDFIQVISKINNKERPNEITVLRNGIFHYKETWLFALKNKLVTNQILFLVLFNTKDSFDVKIKLINDLMRRMLFKKECLIDYEKMYDNLDEIDRRYKNKDFFDTTKMNIKVPEICQEIKTEEKPEFTFISRRSELTTDEKSIEWFKARSKDTIK
ncbi:hypothetical protein P3W45_000397 [Vairimorpha bombi]|jgi:hypothetical protein